eukprot:178031-Pelagomonas_calceolata.AAC.7
MPLKSFDYKGPAYSPRLWLIGCCLDFGFKNLGLDTHKATKLALKLHAQSVQYAYKLASTRRALEETPLIFCHQDQAQATARIHGASALGILFSLIDIGSVFTACVLFLFLGERLHNIAVSSATHQPSLDSRAWVNGALEQPPSHPPDPDLRS